MKRLKLFENFQDNDFDWEESETKTYKFLIHETSVGSIEVEAKNEEEARELANEEYSDGNTYWGRTNVEFDLDN